MAADGKQTDLRHLWLASLGAVVVVRREARATAKFAVASVVDASGKAIALATDARDVIRGGCMVIGELAEARLAAIRTPVTARRAR